MRNSFERMLRLAEIYYDSGDIESLNKFCVYFGPFMKKCAHYIPDEKSETPDFFKKNLDYAPYENSPYFGNVKDFLKKFPGGIGDWLEWRKKDKEKIYQESNQRKKKAHFMPEKGEDVAKFEKEKPLYSDHGFDNFDSVEKFLENYRKDGQSADDAAFKAVNDVVNYWKQMLKKKDVKKETQYKCPICEGKIVRNSKCASSCVHDLKALRDGHGPVCENGHNVGDGVAIDKNGAVIFLKDNK